MKKFICCIIILALVGSGFSSVAFADNTLPEVISLADSLKAITLFAGTDAGYEEERTLNRTEAVVMVLRILGLEEDTLSYAGSHGFDDVPRWADSYVALAYDMGITAGISDSKFGADMPAESNMFLTFVLRALGYVDGVDKDFIWQMPYAIASEAGILPPDCSFTDFLREDAVKVVSAALFAHCKDTGVPLYEKLISDGVFTHEEFRLAFPQDPWYEYKELCDAVRAKAPYVMPFSNQHSHFYYFPLSIEEDNGVLSAIVMEYGSSYTVSEGNLLTVNGSTWSVRRIDMNPDTYEIISEDYNPIKYEDVFPASALGGNNSYLWKGIEKAFEGKMKKIIDSGEMKYRAPSYEEALRDTLNREYIVDQTIESEQCTIILCRMATPHGATTDIIAVYKPGSQYGEGKVVSFPMPLESPWGITHRPDDIQLSEDGNSLNYSYHYDSDMILDPGTDSEWVIHEAGTYNYSVDLLTAQAELNIVK